MIVMLLTRMLKHIFIALVLGFVLCLFLQFTYDVAHPVLPISFVEFVKTSRMPLVFIKHRDGLALQSLGLLIYGTSFGVIGFKLYKNKGLFSKVFISSLLVCLFSAVVIIAKMNDASHAVIYSIVTLPIIVVAALVIKDNRKKQFGKKPKVKDAKPSSDSFTFYLNIGKVILNNPYRGIYIQGGAGSGKSVSLFEPIIQQIAEKEFTGLLYDFKSPELTSKAMSLYKNHPNVESFFVDFKNPFLSHRVNPIDPKYLFKTAYAIEYATVLINNLIPESIKKMDYWNSNAKMILAGVIWYLRNQYPHYCTLPHVISLLLHSDVDSLINEISTDYEAGGMVASLKQGIDRGAEKQVAGILSTIQNSLSQLNTPDIFWILSGNDLNLHLNDPNNPKFLCLGNDATLASTYAPVISLIASVALRLMNQPNQKESIILLDEAPTIYIPNIEQVPATARSNKVSVVFGVQDYSQLVDKYGQDKAQVIISNLGNQFYGRTVNIKSAEMVKNIFGKEDKTYTTSNKGSGSSGQFVHLSSNTNTGTSESVQERDRAKVSDITNLGAGQFYGIVAEGSPQELLKEQFKENRVTTSYNFEVRTTDVEMKVNYNKIVEECKTIIT